ncbi:MAG: hypothetical protein QOF50_1425, partial [Gaiellaceae bacterium]|nr:hypothetical protein [Gaiellaceae bacterium]
MTRVDWVALVVVAVAALVGLRKGLVGSALSLVGIVAGAMLGARLAPALLSGGSRSPWTPLIALGGACVGAIALETVGTILGGAVRRALVVPPLRALDSLGGAALGALAGLALVWILGAGALLVPGQNALRKGAQASYFLRNLNSVVPPGRLLAVLARVEARHGQDRDVVLPIEDHGASGQMRPDPGHLDSRVVLARDDVRRGDDELRTDDPATPRDAEATSGAEDADDARRRAPHPRIAQHPRVRSRDGTAWCSDLRERVHAREDGQQPSRRNDGVQVAEEVGGLCALAQGVLSGDEERACAQDPDQRKPG